MQTPDGHAPLAADTTTTPLHRDPVLRLLGGLSLLSVLGFGFGIGPIVAQVVACWLLLTGVHLVLALTAIRVCLEAVPGSGTRRVWAGVGLAGVAFTVGDLSQLLFIATRPYSISSATGGPVQSVATLLGAGGLVLVVLRQPVRLADRQERLRFWLDVSVVMTFVATTVGYTYVPLNSGSQELLDFLVGPPVLVVGAYAVVKLLLGVDRPFTSAAGWVLGAAATLEAAIAGATELQRSNLSWLLGLTVVASSLLTGAARLQLLGTGRTVATAHRRRRFRVLPYVAVVAGNVLLVWVLATSGLTPRAWVLVVGAIVSTLLVIARQVVAFLESSRLLDELDARIGDLHLALEERDRLAGQLLHQAHHDPLTGLANRALFEAELDRAVEALGSGRTTQLVLMLIDLDDFKPVNDRLGHAAGDRLLVAVAARLRACVRDGDLVARVGGDEFALIMTGPHAPSQALAERIVACAEDPVTIGAEVVCVSASIGVVVAPAAPFDRTPGPGAQDLMRLADEAMYAAKRAGKNGYRLAPV